MYVCVIKKTIDDALLCLGSGLASPANSTILLDFILHVYLLQRLRTISSAVQYLSSIMCYEIVFIIVGKPNLKVFKCIVVLLVTV